MNSPKVAVLTMEGTNNEEEAFQSWKGAGADKLDQNGRRVIYEFSEGRSPNYGRYQ